MLKENYGFRCACDKCRLQQFVCECAGPGAGIEEFYMRATTFGIGSDGVVG